MHLIKHIYNNDNLNEILQAWFNSKNNYQYIAILKLLICWLIVVNDQ